MRFDPLPEHYLSSELIAAAKSEAATLKSWNLTPRQLCDIEMLLDGGFAPLNGFMCRDDYNRVVNEMRLADGSLWPIPVPLDVTEEFADEIAIGEAVALRDPEGVVIALLDVADRWTPDLDAEAQQVLGTDDERHPGVDFLKHRSGRVYLGGRLRGLERPSHYDFRNYRHTPNELRALFAKLGWNRIVAFQTHNPMHRAHHELTQLAAHQAKANLLIHPVVGMAKPDDVDHFTRVRCYERLIQSYPEQTTALSLLPLAMRMAGPREALWHALIRRNYGCSHLIVGRDYAGPGAGSNGQPFYGNYDAQELVRQHQDELQVEMVPFKAMSYVQERAQFVPADSVGEDETVLTVSGTELRRRLQEGLEVPDWFTFPTVLEELRRTYPPRSKQGFTVFFTGLSGAGKSTIANALLVKLMELGDRPVTLLDGDVVRQNLSSELTFSKEHRDLNIRRIGYVASEITKNGGIAICAPIAPYRTTRREVRQMIEAVGAFIEVFVATPLDVCEDRDRKGLYKQARAGIIKNFTGIDDPYEEPERAEMRLDTTALTPDESAHELLLAIESMGLII